MTTHPMYDGEIDVDGDWEDGEPPLIHIKSSRGIPQCRVRLSIEEAEDLIRDIRIEIDKLKELNPELLTPGGDFPDDAYRPPPRVATPPRPTEERVVLRGGGRDGTTLAITPGGGRVLIATGWGSDAFERSGEADGDGRAIFDHRPG